MDQVIINEKDNIVMNLVHYFVTEQDYNPVVVHGINDEIWLENMQGEYKIVRIVSSYIHNNEQLGFNRFRCRQVAKKLRLKTFSFKMSVLSIFVNIGDNVTELGKDDKNNLSLNIRDISDIKNNPTIMEIFPNISEKTDFKEEGMELLFKITDDINVSNEKKNKKMEKIFSKKKPIVTYIIMALCIIMFFLSGMGLTTESLINFGANYYPYVNKGEIYRLFTSMFLHIGLLHLFFNMYALYQIGPRVEDFFGKWKYILIYILSGITGSLMMIGFDKEAVSAGASSAIFGLFGALLYFAYTYRGYIGSVIRSTIIPTLIVNFIIGFTIPGIGVWAHIGGFIGGLLTSNMVGTIENKEYKITNILLFLMYFVFTIYFGIFM